MGIDRVILIDSDEEIRELFGEILSMASQQLLVFASYNDLSHQITRKQILLSANQLVFIEINQDESFDLERWNEIIHRLHPAKVVAMTSFSTASFETILSSTGVEAVLSKPFRIEQIDKLLNSFFTLEACGT